MKKVIDKIFNHVVISTLILIFITPAIQAQNTHEDAVKAYQEERYEDAIKILEKEVASLAEKGLESSQLYYNLGNAYFRDNDIAKAILNYERANLVNPGDKDIRTNLEFARTKTEDKIISVDSFFLDNWFNAVQNLQSANAWAKLSIVIFIIFMISLSGFFFTRRIFVKQTTFYIGIVSLVLLITTNVFAYRQENKIKNRNTAIVTAGSASIRTSPDSNSKEVFILHSGTKVRINKRDGSWMEIEIDNGNIGWITKDKVEII